MSVAAWQGDGMMFGIIYQGDGFPFLTHQMTSNLGWATSFLQVLS